MAKARKQRFKILLSPKEHEVKKVCSKLPLFKPHDLRSLITEAKTNDDKADVDTAFLLALRRRNDTQMKELLRRLGVDPSRSDAWERGFFHLAFLHYGVGHLAWYSRRTNRNSATWTPTHDLALLREVVVLRQRRLSERAAVKELASDPKKRQLFPYRKQRVFLDSRRVPKTRGGVMGPLAETEAIGPREVDCRLVSGR
jgi:transcriptional regulator with XRE-family HTH domain